MSVYWGCFVKTPHARCLLFRLLSELREIVRSIPIILQDPESTALVYSRGLALDLGCLLGLARATQEKHCG